MMTTEEWNDKPRGEVCQIRLDTDVRVIDQRVGMGVGGRDTVIRLYHKPTGILIEMPRLASSQSADLQAAFDMLEFGLAGVRV
jgi:protein subunit release factor A